LLETAYVSLLYTIYFYKYIYGIDFQKKKPVSHLLVKTTCSSVKKHLALFNFVHMYSVLSILTLFTRRMDGYREFEMLKIKLETMTLKNLEQSNNRIQFNDGVKTDKRRNLGPTAP
jgi:hypothetical protein